ncbi:Polysaccharide lyase family 4, domain III [Amycolatopsis arida]|uniref:Polysaccharide lyase family 4, domain III n=1 Tax=Amycolatopsis arida TaxID=587909 RepID=A0A1I5LXN0_9PSEU|nr:polysaccharide lyase family protein [Amycolatopsis arida]TDX93888.1 polysaccharide lyase family 4-like protein [Amycolatopsis arida]SFP01992.1 Polysaccharide lyase family 4, domain III [Amycolatopsis arida]
MSDPTTSASTPTARDLAARPGIGRIELTWRAHRPYHPLVDHFAVYGSPDPAFRPGPATLLGKTIDTHLRHEGLGPRASTWHYRVVTVAASGGRSRPTGVLRATSTESVTVAGRPVAVVGEFDRRSLELALAPDGYARYLTRFPDGADYVHGVSTPGVDWPYLHPGPADRWAGSRAHTFRLRFRLVEPPAGDLALAVWLIDTHASIPGRLDVACNGTDVARVELERGATKGSLRGDATAPDSPLRPSIVEIPLPRAALVAVENVLAMAKREGSWHAYDAVGVFAPPGT